MPLIPINTKKVCYISCDERSIESGRCECNKKINLMKLPWDQTKKTLEMNNDISCSEEEFKKHIEEVKEINGDYLKEDKITFWGGLGIKDSIAPNQLQYEVKSYPDGSKYVIVHKIVNQMVFKINSYEDLWILNQIHDVVKNSWWKVTVTIPNLIDAQADRRFSNDQPHGLKLVCEFLNSMTNFSFKIFHPHNPEVVEALLDRVEIIDNHDFIYEVLGEIKGSSSYDFNAFDMEDKLILMSTDAGGFKPLMKLADKLSWGGETYSASKSRKYEDGKSKLIQLVDRTDFEGKDILIIDDICSKGGTFKGLSTLLKERNCGKLYLAVSHMTIQDLGEDSVTNYFDKVFTSNSKFDSYYADFVKNNNNISQPENLEVIKLF